jgi:hypothetical protein
MGRPGNCALGSNEAATRSGQPPPVECVSLLWVCVPQTAAAWGHEQVVGVIVRELLAADWALTQLAPIVVLTL